MSQLIRKSQEKLSGVPPVFTMKLLVACISVAFFVLSMILIGLLAAGENRDIELLTGNQGLEFWGAIVLGCGGVFVLLSAVYVLFGMLANRDAWKKYRKFYQLVGIGLLVLLFITMGIWGAMAIMALGGVVWVTIFGVFVAGLLSFAPIVSAWWLDDEMRLKIFLESMARVCATLTFIGGGCVFLLNSLF